jgi:hypothetical protein
MAGIFDVGVGDVMGSNVSPESPVSKPANFGLGLLAGAVGVGSKMFEKQQELDYKASQELAKGQVLADVNDRLESISQAVGTGKKTKDWANTQISVLNKRVVASNPAMAEDITNFFNKKLGAAWSGGIINKETEQEAIHKKLLSGATSRNFIPNNATPDEVELGIAKYQRATAFEDQQKALMQELSIRGKQISNRNAISSEARAVANQAYEESRRQLTDSLYSYMPYEMDRVVGGLQKGFDDWLSSGKDKSKGEELRNQIMLDKEIQRKKIAEIGKYSPETQRVGDSLLSVYDNYAKRLDAADESQLKSLEDEFKRKQFAAVSILTSKMSPEDQVIAMASPALPYMTAVQSMAGQAYAKAIPNVTASDVASIWATNANSYDITSNPFPKEPRQKAAMDQYTKDLMTGYDKAILSGDKEVVGDYNKQINGYLNSLKDFSGNIKSPQDITNTIKVLSDPRFKKFMESGQADPDAINGALNVYEVYYRDNVLKTAERLYQGYIPTKYSRGDIGTTPRTYNISKDVEPRFDGNTLSFGVKGQVLTPREVRDNAALNELKAMLDPFMAVSSNLQGKDKQWVFDNIVLPTVFGISPEVKGEPK